MMDVGILGATGMVGQQFVALLTGHPWFRVAWLGGSARSEGKRYEDAASWRLAAPLDPEIARLTVEACTPGRTPTLLFSALDAAAASEIEPAFAAAGHVVLSNARSLRMQPDVPLLVPEINPDHLRLADRQAGTRGWSGCVVTNPNCATVVLAMALAPLRQFGLQKVLVTTMQAISGAGYPGVPSWDILGNVIPFIDGEEPKIETETGKILGALADGTVTPHSATISAQATRVAVQHGHTVSVSVALEQAPPLDIIVDAWRSFRGRPQALALPSAPREPLVYLPQPNRPQPTLDLDGQGGMAVSIGRLRTCPVLTHKFVALGHNTIRGAAGASILNAELMHREGRL